MNDGNTRIRGAAIAALNFAHLMLALQELRCLCKTTGEPDITVAIHLPKWMFEARGEDSLPLMRTN